MKQIRDRYTETYGSNITCICPRCGKKHIAKLNWIGRGTPRKFCIACGPVVEKYESTPPARFNAWAAVHTLAALKSGGAR